MRRQDLGGLMGAARRIPVGGLRLIAPPAVIAGLLVLAVGAIAADSSRLVGPPSFAEPAEVPPFAQPITDDVRRMRSYPEQPPIIPHDIEEYQLTLTANTCLTCHSRQFVEGSGAPMISVTHFMDREGQMLADISPRRYFCLGCHVPQTNAVLPVNNTFVDMLAAERAGGAK